MTDEKHPLSQAIVDAGLTMTARFIPWSQSRNKHEKHPTLNWVVTVLHNGRPIIETDYGAGCAHCPAYKSKLTPLAKQQAIKWECENGFEASWHENCKHFSRKNKTPLSPDIESVVYSLLLDGNAIDHPDFESWACNCGYDTDSRKAEAIYRTCLEIGLKLRNALGDATLRKLQEAAQDY